MKKRNIRYHIPYLLFLLAFLSCENEPDQIMEEPVADERTGNFSFKGMKGREIYENSDVLRLMKISSIRNSLSKTNKLEEGFILDTTSVNYFQIGDYHSYTFNVISEVPIDGFQNVVYISQTDGSYAEYLYTYHLTVEEQKLLESGTAIDLEGKVTKELLSTNNDNGFLNKEGLTARSGEEFCSIDYWKRTGSDGGRVYEDKDDCETAFGEGNCTFDSITVRCPEVIEAPDSGGGGPTPDHGGSQGYVFIIYDAPLTRRGGLGFADGDGNIVGGLGGGGITSPVVNTIAYELRVKLGIYNIEPEAYWLETHQGIAEEIYDFLEENDNPEGEQIALEIIENLIEGSASEKTLAEAFLEKKYDEVIEIALDKVEYPQYDTCPNPPCVGEFDAAVVLVAQVINNAYDGFFNILLFSLEANLSDAKKGKAIRKFMSNSGIAVPSDVDNKSLGQLFKIRVRGRESILEPANVTIKDNLLDWGISLVDISTIASPGQGGSAYLLAKSGTGAITKESFSAYVKLLKDIAETTLRGGKGYTSFAKYKAAEGFARANHAYHHIVEQGGFKRLNQLKFGKTNIHNTKNIVEILTGPGTLHNRVTSYYQSIDRNLHPTKTVREWLADKSFEFQYEFGINKLRDFGWTGTIQ